MNQEKNSHRRTFLATSGGLAAASLLGGATSTAAAASAAAPPPLGKRRLGALEVSALGLGVQNMSRTYQTTVPNRAEMHSIIRAAFERGVTFFDAAEAYGPHEVERILGEAIAPFRNQVVVATKFGFNIDLQTGARSPGRNSRPEHIKARR